MYRCMAERQVEIWEKDWIIKNQTAKSTCANNCKGVDPNSIVSAGAAVVGAAAIGAQGIVGPALGGAGILGENDGGVTG